MWLQTASFYKGANQGQLCVCVSVHVHECRLGQYVVLNSCFYGKLENKNIYPQHGTNYDIMADLVWRAELATEGNLCRIYMAFKLKPYEWNRHYVDVRETVKKEVTAVQKDPTAAKLNDHLMHFELNKPQKNFIMSTFVLLMFLIAFPPLVKTAELVTTAFPCMCKSIFSLMNRLSLAFLEAGGNTVSPLFYVSHPCMCRFFLYLKCYFCHYYCIILSGCFLKLLLQ